MERLNMNKTSSEQYRAELEQAMAEEENWGEDVDLEDLSEAEQLAHSADRPKLRKDGEHKGSEVRRPKPLSPRQVLFTQGVILGKSLRQAYRDAYANDTGSDASISASANKLMKDPRIKHILKEAWEETAEHLSEDLSASKRYVLKGLLALSKKATQEGTKLKALELLGKASGLFTPSDVQDKAVITADQLKRELSGHMKLLEQGKANVLDVDAKRLNTLKPVEQEGRVNEGILVPPPVPDPHLT
jgi:hypothetical protein